MRLKYTGGNVCPPDKFQFTCPHCGYHLPGQFAIGNFFDAVADHYRMNEHPLPEDWREMAEDQMCQLLPAGWSAYGDGSEPEYFINTRMTGADVINGTKVLLDLTRKAIAFKWFGGESPIVSQEEADYRALTCARCHMNVTVEGCGSCHGIANMVAEVAGKITTPSDSALRGCGICHCSNLAQTRVNIKILAMGVPGEIRAMFDKVPHCWKRIRLEELRLTEAESASTTTG